MNTQSHLEETLQRDIDLLRNRVAEMANLAERALKTSVQALVEGNRRLAYSVILRDQYIDALETELDRNCLEFLVRHQPAGSHLRFAYAVIQINKELERIGDYAESIARQALAVAGLEQVPPWTRFQELADLSIHMVRDSVQAFLQQNADLAWRTMAIEERANALRSAINGEISELNGLGKLRAEAVNPLLTIARRLERVADQAKNVCEDVLYFCTGEFIKHKTADAFRVLFLDITNANVSQMAEGIGRSLKLPHFVFSSAGFTPQPVDPRTVEFMAGKGINISEQTSKSLEQVPDWERYQVLVSLSGQVREFLPSRPGKIVLLSWSIADPSANRGDTATVNQAFETAFEALESNIRDLVGAILDEPQPELRL